MKDDDLLAAIRSRFEGSKSPLAVDALELVRRFQQLYHAYSEAMRLIDDVHKALDNPHVTYDFLPTFVGATVDMHKELLDRNLDLAEENRRLRMQVPTAVELDYIERAGNMLLANDFSRTLRAYAVRAQGMRPKTTMVSVPVEYGDDFHKLNEQLDATNEADE